MPLQRKNQSGQAYVETLIALPLFILFLVGMVVFFRMYYTKIVLDQAARQGMFLVANYEYGADAVKTAIIDTLQSEHQLLSTVSRQDISVELHSGFTPSRVTVSASFALPVLFQRILGRDRFTVTGFSECFTGYYY